MITTRNSSTGLDLKPKCRAHKTFSASVLQENSCSKPTARGRKEKPSTSRRPASYSKWYVATNYMLFSGSLETRGPTENTGKKHYNHKQQLTRS